MFRKGVIEVPRAGISAFIVSTSVWIHDHLSQVGEDYIAGMYRQFKLEKQSRGLRCGSYQNFRQYVWWLIRLGLIEYRRSQRSANPKLKKRRYYGLVPGTETNPAWRNPRKHLYPESWKKAH